MACIPRFRINLPESAPRNQKKPYFFSRDPSGFGGRGVPHFIKHRDLKRLGWTMVEVPFDLTDHRIGQDRASRRYVKHEHRQDFVDVMNLIMTGSYNSPNYAKYSFGDGGNVVRDKDEEN